VDLLLLNSAVGKGRAVSGAGDEGFGRSAGSTQGGGQAQKRDSPRQIEYESSIKTPESGIPGFMIIIAKAILYRVTFVRNKGQQF
jgi:hypothetical protein